MGDVQLMASARLELLLRGMDVVLAEYLGPQHPVRVEIRKVIERAETTD